ncbi:MAG: hypothetical protein RR303_02445 [Bacteroidales bacterium]
MELNDKHPKETKHDIKHQEKFDEEKHRKQEHKREEAHVKAESLKDKAEAGQKKDAAEKWSEKD